MSPSSENAINEQEQLVRDIKQACSLVDTARGHQDIQQSSELSSVADVLMLAVNNLFELQQEQETKLELMNSTNDEAERLGGDR